jgi:hypothetical protein
MIWKEAFLASFKVVPQNLSGEAQKNHKNPQRIAGNLAEYTYNIPARYIMCVAREGRYMPVWLTHIFQIHSL